MARQDLPERIAALETGLAEARSTAADLAAAVQQQEVIGKQGEAASRLAGLEQTLAATQAMLLEAVDAHQRLVDEYQGAMEARLAYDVGRAGGPAGRGRSLPGVRLDGSPRPGPPERR